MTSTSDVSSVVNPIDAHGNENDQNVNEEDGKEMDVLIEGRQEHMETGQASDGEVIDEGMSHHDAMLKLQNGLSKIIQEDPLLCDLPKQVTLEEIKSKIALEYGQAMTVNIRKASDEVMPVVVVQNGTVRDLKNAIKRFIILKLERENTKKAMSWTYVWRTYWLQFDGEKLEHDHKPIKEYGIRNKDEVKFVKKLQKT